ncbi:MAG: chromate transporter [Clostridia bacterium]|nr:chromate transporter [Clostridia bacterium]
MIKTYLELFRVFFKIGAFTFGGGYAMIPLIEEEIVSVKGWVEKEDMIDMLAVSQSIPGAIAINTSTLVGYKVAGKLGAIFATLGVILPSFLIISFIAMFFSKISDSNIVETIFAGISGAVIVLIFLAAVKMLKVAVKDVLSVILVVITVLVVLFTDVSPIYLIMFGGVTGVILYGVMK